MRIRVVHDTHYRYDRPARSLIQAHRLTPRSHDGQHVRRWRIEPSVDGRLSPREDGLGNLVHMFSMHRPTEELTIRVIGEVDTHDTGGIVRGAVERVPDAFFLRETDLTTTDEPLRDFAESAASGGGDVLEFLHRLLIAVNRTVTFDTGPTHTATTAVEAFALGRGVCQDLSHIFIAAARHRGVPARYVSGYFRRGDGVVDQEAGHAWAEAKVPGLGWVGFDPTNGICTTEAHLRVAVGLDYLGAAPIRGSRRGGGGESLTVRLRVEDQRQAQHQS